MRPLPLLLALSACAPVAASVGDTDTAIPDTDEADADTDADSDADTDADSDADTDADTEPAEAPDYRVAGPRAVAHTSGEAEVNGCRMAWDRYTPTDGDSSAIVLLSHGFMRGRENLAENAEHLASWGLTVVTPDLCHASAWDADHAQNGADLVALADHLGAARVVYAGHSAGGLASLLAGAADPRAVAVLGLDAVDSEDLGKAAAPTLNVPLYGLAGESSSCNSDNNGVAWYTLAGDGRALRVVEADHCNFEGPTDWACTSFCGTSNPTFDDATLSATIRGFATAFLVWQAGEDPLGEQWWTPGSTWRDQLEGEGAITAL